MKALSKKIIVYAITFALAMIALSMPMAVADEAASIDSVDVVTKDVDTGSADEWYDTINGEVVTYNYYDPWGFIESYTVTMSDGGRVTMESSNSGFAYDGIEYSVHCESDQSYNNQWDVGEHSITLVFSIKGDEVDEYGDLIWEEVFRVSFDVEVVVAPVVSAIDITPKVVFKETGGDWISYDDEDDPETAYYKYYGHSFVKSCIVTINGEPYTANYTPEDGWKIPFGSKSYPIVFNTDQSYSNQWEPGTHQIKVTTLGFSQTFDGTIIPSPITDIEITGKDVKEETGGKWDIFWDKDYDVHTNVYLYHEKSFVESVTVTDIDGKEVTLAPDGKFVYDGTEFELVLTSEQDKPWAAGEHTITAEIAGYKEDLDVMITKGVVTDIELTTKDVLDSEYSEILQGWNAAAQEMDTYYAYRMTDFFSAYTLTFEDGSKITCDVTDENAVNGNPIYGNPYTAGGGFYHYITYQYKGEDYRIRLLCTPPRFDTAWKAGPHTVTAQSAGCSKDFTVNLVHDFEEAFTPATFEEDGSIKKVCAFDGAISVLSTIPRIGTPVLDETTYIFDGTNKQPRVTVKDVAGNTLTEGTDYTLTYPDESIQVGSYDVLVTFHGNYTGYTTLRYHIEHASTLPQTGDHSNLGLWMVLGALALGGLATVGMKRKKAAQ